LDSYLSAAARVLLCCFPCFQFRSLLFTASSPTQIYTLSLHDALPIFIFVHASAFKFREERAEWIVSCYPYRDIISLESNDEDYDYEDFESGVLFIKLENEKGAVRRKTIRNINPNHFECIRGFHEKMQRGRYI